MLLEKHYMKRTYPGRHKDPSALMYGSVAWTVTNTLSRRLDAFDTWSFRKIPRISYTRHVTKPMPLSGRLPVALSFFSYSRKIAPLTWGMWQGRISNMINITVSSARPFDHHVNGEDLEGACVPPDWGTDADVQSANIGVHSARRNTDDGTLW